MSFPDNSYFSTHYFWKTCLKCRVDSSHFARINPEKIEYLVKEGKEVPVDVPEKGKGRGSYVRMVHPGPIPIGTLSKIIRQAELSEDELKKL